MRFHAISWCQPLEAKPGKPTGWIDANTVVQALNLLKTDEAIGTPQPTDAFFTHALLTP
jgi:hypothetical protein